MLPKLGRPDTGRCAAVVVCVALLFAYWCGQTLLVHGQAQDPRVASKNGDVNGDERRDLADVVYFLGWLFEGGPEPVALAQEDPDVEFGRRIAGSYFGVAETTSQFPDIVTLHADGTYTGTSAGPAFGANTEHGVWERVGDREIAFTSMIIGFDEAGVEGFVFRVRGITTVSEDFQSLTVSFDADVFTIDQNPFEDEPVQVNPGTVEFRRIPIMEFVR